MKISVGDIIRIPIGIIITCYSILGMYKVWMVLGWNWIRIVIVVVSVPILLMFFAIGFVMMFRWVGEGSGGRRSKKRAGGGKQASHSTEINERRPE
jgi:hypothetical protein